MWHMQLYKKWCEKTQAKQIYLQANYCTKLKKLTSYRKIPSNAILKARILRAHAVKRTCYSLEASMDDALDRHKLQETGITAQKHNFTRSSAELLAAIPALHRPLDGSNQQDGQENQQPSGIFSEPWEPISGGLDHAAVCRLEFSVLCILTDLNRGAVRK